MTQEPVDPTATGRAGTGNAVQDLSAGQGARKPVGALSGLNDRCAGRVAASNTPTGCWAELDLRAFYLTQLSSVARPRIAKGTVIAIDPWAGREGQSVAAMSVWVLQPKEEEQLASYPSCVSRAIPRRGRT